MKPSMGEKDRGDYHLDSNTVNVEIFAQYIISRISRRVLDAQRFGVSENYDYNRTNRTNCYVHENLITRICLPEVDVRKI